MRVLVVGAGLIGTSVALAVRTEGCEVRLADRDPEPVATAVEMGAGRPDDGARVDLAVIAVPPAAVPAVLAELQSAGRAAVCTDVASVKGTVLAGAAELRCNLRSFVGGHPVAGRERSGPTAASAELFRGRPWVLTPTQETDPAALAAAEALVARCGATVFRMPAAAHDRALALTSHTPALVASALAARLADAPPETTRLAGQGLRDLTRIADSDPALWTDILAGNAAAVADEVDAVAAGLAAAAAALRAGRTDPVRDLLTAGRAGRGRLPGKHGGARAAYAPVAVVVPDRPGRLARLLADVAAAGANVEDIGVDHAPGAPLGVITLAVEPGSRPALVSALRARAWTVQD